MATVSKRIPRNVLILAFVALASGFGQDLITPILPAYLTLLGVSSAGVGLIDGLLEGTASFFRFVSGVLSDHFHQRKFFVFLGYTLSSVTRPLLAITQSIAPIAALRVMDGAGKGMKDAPRDALVADSATTKTYGRTFGFQRFIDTAGSVIGPLVAGLILLSFLPILPTYRLIFALSAIPGVIALVLIWFGVREPALPRRAVQIKIRHLPWPFWVFTIGSAIAMLTKVNDLLFLLRAQSIGMPQAWIPFLFAGFTFVSAACAYPIGIVSDRKGKLPFIALGWLVLAIVEFFFSSTPSIPIALGLFVFYGVFYALTEGSGRALIADLVPSELRGSAYAIFHTIVGVCVIAGGFGIGQLWDRFSPSFAFHVASIGSLIGFFVFALMAVKTRKGLSIGL